MTDETALLLVAELHRLNELVEARLTIEHPNWSKTKPVPVRKVGNPKLVEVSAPTVEVWNENYRKAHGISESEEDW